MYALSFHGLGVNFEIHQVKELQNLLFVVVSKHYTLMIMNAACRRLWLSWRRFQVTAAVSGGAGPAGQPHEAEDGDDAGPQV